MAEHDLGEITKTIFTKRYNGQGIVKCYDRKPSVGTR